MLNKNKILRNYDDFAGDGIGALADNLYERCFFSLKSFNPVATSFIAQSFFDEAGLFDGKNVKGNIQTPGKFTDGIFVLNAVAITASVDGSAAYIPGVENSAANEEILNGIFANSIIRLSEVNKKIIDIPLFRIIKPYIAVNPKAGASTAATIGQKTGSQISGVKIFNVPKKFKKDATFTCQMIGYNPSASGVTFSIMIEMLGRYLED